MPPRRPKMKAKPKRKAYSIRKPVAKKAIRRIVKKEISKKLETKRSCFSSNDGVEVGHNSFISLDTQMLHTTQGTQDPSATQGFNRIGDEITLKGVSIKMMLELNERYSDVTYRLFLVKSARGDNPNTSGLFWNNLSANRMLDTVNTERYTILFQKTGKIKSGNFGGQTVSGGALSGGGLFDVGGTNVNLYTRQTKIEKIYIPASKWGFSRIRYDSSGVVQKFFDYYFVIYAYSNFSTSDLLGFNVLRVNDYVRQMYYTDA